MFFQMIVKVTSSLLKTMLMNFLLRVMTKMRKQMHRQEPSCLP